MAANKGGRPRKTLDYEQIDKLCEIHCTQEEIAAVMKTTVDTLDAACKRDHGHSFSEYQRKMSLTGKKSLRRMMWESAEKGNTTMLIWLSKQYLNMREPQQENIVPNDELNDDMSNYEK